MILRQPLGHFDCILCITIQINRMKGKFKLLLLSVRMYKDEEDIEQ